MANSEVLSITVLTCEYWEGSSLKHNEALTTTLPNTILFENWFVEGGIAGYTEVGWISKPIWRGHFITDSLWELSENKHRDQGHALQAKECQRLPANHQKLVKSHRTDSPSQPSSDSKTGDTLIMDFYSTDQKTINFCCSMSSSL